MKKILVLAGCGRRRHGRVPGSCKGGCQRRQGGQCQQHRHCCHRHCPRLHFHSRLVIVIMWAPRRDPGTNIFSKSWLLCRSRIALRWRQQRRWRWWWRTRSSSRSMGPASPTSATPRRKSGRWRRWWRWWLACSAGTRPSPRRALATSRTIWWAWPQTWWRAADDVLIRQMNKFSQGQLVLFALQINQNWHNSQSGVAKDDIKLVKLSCEERTFFWKWMWMLYLLSKYLRTSLCVTNCISQRIQNQIRMTFHPDHSMWHQSFCHQYDPCDGDDDDDDHCGDDDDGGDDDAQFYLWVTVEIDDNWSER